MSNIRALIIDDESLARKGLRLRLKGFEGIEIVGECSDGRAALNAIAVKARSHFPGYPNARPWWI